MIETGQAMATIQWTFIAEIFAATMAFFGAIAVAVIAALARRMFLSEVKPKLESIDAAVNHGRMERIESNVSALKGDTADVHRYLRDGGHVMQDHDGRLRQIERSMKSMDSRLMLMEKAWLNGEHSWPDISTTQDDPKP